MDHPAALHGTPRTAPQDPHAGPPPANDSADAIAPEPRWAARRPPASVTVPARVPPSSHIARENRRGRGVAERRWQVAGGRAEKHVPPADEVENPSQCGRRMVQPQGPTGHGGLLRGVEERVESAAVAEGDGGE